ncbi:MAG: invasion associated locus B family protein [Hyphomicrobiales bacterium]|nr:invasion associated locus B family protein [Hyphomicrobiales bacterium]
MVAKKISGMKGIGAYAGLVAFAVAMSASLATAPAIAQENKDQASSAWVKLCEQAPDITNPEQKLDVCLTHHEHIDGRTGQVVVSAAIRQVQGQDKKALMVMVPLGMALPPGIQMKIDENDPVSLKYTLCHVAGCTAEAEATAAIVDQMKGGQKLVVAAINLAGQAIAFPDVPLAGFTTTLDGDPVDNAQYKEARKRLMMSIRERQILAAKEARDRALAEQQNGGEEKKQ